MILALGSPDIRIDTPFSATSSPTRGEPLLRPLRRNMQVGCSSSPSAPFNPRHNVERLVSEPLHLLEKQLPTARSGASAVASALTEVDCTPPTWTNTRHEFSGGQSPAPCRWRACPYHPVRS